jgi:ABC-type polysaccharide/polyol phosphate export permease
MGYGWMKWIYLANPMTPLVLAYRRVFLYSTMDMPGGEIDDGTLLASLGLCFFMTLIWMAIAVKVFKHYSRSFADEV